MDFAGRRHGFAPADAAFRDADFGGRHGRVSPCLVHTVCWRQVGRTRLAADLRQRVFNLPVLVRSAYQGFVRVPQARFAIGTIFGRGRVEAVVWVEWPVVRAWVAGGALPGVLYCFQASG